jgi:hypothetical protein
MNGNIPRQVLNEHGQSAMMAEDIFQMHPECKLYGCKKFSSCLSNLQKHVMNAGFMLRLTKKHLRSTAKRTI